jgi:hypothetical protein
MGAAAVAGADRVWVTDDNPRSEDPAAIRAAVLAGAPGAIDAGAREAAIAAALSDLGPGDVLAVAGKGHESGQEIAGTVRAVKGLVLAVEQLPLPVGSLVRVSVPNRVDWPRGEVVGFEGTRALVMLLAEADGVATGATVIGEQPYSTVGVNEWWLGRVVDALGRPIDGKGDIPPGSPQPMWPPRTSPLTRGVIRDVLPTGVRAIDSMLTIGKGQRMGIFAGPGVGKSTLLGSIARGTTAHVNVIGLIGERGREVPEFLEHVLGEEGLKNSVVVVATGDESPLMRVRAATVACSVAEYFRDQGLDVLLMLDSVTRFAQAQRQIGLSAGEAPATKGFTPSVFSMLPRLLAPSPAARRMPRRPAIEETIRSTILATPVPTITAALAALAENPKHTKTRERSAGIVALLEEVAAHIAAQIERNDDAG